MAGDTRDGDDGALEPTVSAGSGDDLGGVLRALARAPVLDPQAPREPFAVGDVVEGRFALQRLLGSGGFGCVYLADDRKMGRRVALKVVARRGAALTEAEARDVRREVQATARLRHPNIVVVHETGEWGGHPCLVLEYLEGRTLDRRLTPGGLPWREALAIVEQICGALACAHDRGILHLDLKPRNVMCLGDGTIKLLDFGLASIDFQHASLLEVAGRTPDELQRHVGQSPPGAGTPAYLAPEQWRRGPVDPRTDVWAVGVLTFELLTGVLPFRAPLEELRAAITAEGPPPSPRALRGDVPRAVDAVVRRAMARAPADRFADVASLVAALRAARDRSGWRGALRRVRQRHLAIAAAGGLLAAGSWAIWSRPPEPIGGEPSTTFRPAMVWLPAAEFAMGSPEGEVSRRADEVPHPVRLTRAIAVARTEVTQGQWHAVMGTDPSRFAGDRGGGPDHPVERVNWYEAVAYVNALSTKEGREACYEMTACAGAPGGGCPEGPGDTEGTWCDGEFRCEGVRLRRGLDCTGYRLPTDAEWEYAARAGATTALYTGDLRFLMPKNAPDLDPIAWYIGNSRPASGTGVGCLGDFQYRGDRCATHPVGAKRANAFGLYDVIGGVWEWTHDGFDEAAYIAGTAPGATATDPAGDDHAARRSTRGGSWAAGAHDCRLAARMPQRPVYRHAAIGFRPVRTLSPDEPGAAR